MITLLLSPLIALSAVGLTLSILAYIACLLGLSLHPTSSILQAGIFVVFLPVVLVMKLYVPGRDIQDLKVALSGAPKWMRYTTYGFVGYSVFNFILFMSIAPDQPGSIIKDTASWIAFYSASLVMLYSALQIHKKGIMHTCPNGHKVPLSAEYCDKCGEQMRDLNVSW